MRRHTPNTHTHIQTEWKRGVHTERERERHTESERYKSRDRGIAFRVVNCEREERGVVDREREKSYC